MELENRLEKYIFETTEFVFRFLKTFLEISVNPSRFFEMYYSNTERHHLFAKPISFLLINLVLSNAISLLRGKNIPEVPVVNVLINKYFTDISFLILTYFFGYFFFSWVLSWIANKNSERKIDFKNCLDLFCFGSIAFVPIVLIDVVGFKLLDEPLTKILMNNYTAVINHSDLNLNGIEKSDYFRIFLGFLLLILEFFLWYKTIISGLKCLLIKKPIRVFLFSGFIYEFVKLFFVGLFFFCLYQSTFRAIEDLTNKQFDLELDKDKPNLALILKTSSEIETEKRFPNYLRYKVGLISLACESECLSPLKFKGLLKEVCDFLKDGNDNEAYLIIRKRIGNFNNLNIKEYQLYLSLNKHLGFLEELKNSNDSSDVISLKVQNSENEYTINKSDHKNIKYTNIYYSTKTAYPSTNGKKALRLGFVIPQAIFVLRVFPI